MMSRKYSFQKDDVLAGPVDDEPPKSRAGSAFNSDRYDMVSII